MSVTVDLLVFFLVLHLFSVTAIDAANPSPLSYEIYPFVKVYQNSTVQRLTGTETVPPSFDPNNNVLSKDITVSASSNITARLYLPAVTNGSVGSGSNKKLPLLVYFHGGAFFTGSAFSPTYHNYLNSLVARARVVAVSVNYRLAPEHLLPIGYRDSWLALQWVFSHIPKGSSSSSNGNINASETWLRKYVDFEHVYVGGDGAGGNIAHNMAIRAGSDEATGVLLDGLFLNYPHFWGKNLIGNEYNYTVVARAWVGSIWDHAYPNSTGGLDDPLLNPVKDPNLMKLGCKRVLVYVAEKDILKDRGLYYGKVLNGSFWNGDVKVVEVKGEGHVFNLNSPNTEKAKAMLEEVGLFLNHDDVKDEDYGLNADWPKPAARRTVNTVSGAGRVRVSVSLLLTCLNVLFVFLVTYHHKVTFLLLMLT